MRPEESQELEAEEEEEDFPVTLPPEIPPDWDFRLRRKIERPRLHSHSRVFDLVWPSCQRWLGERRVLPPDPAAWGRKPPPADWRAPRRMGGFEVLVVLALLRLDEDGCATEVVQLIKDRTGRTVTIQTVTKALARLRARRYVQPVPPPQRWETARWVWRFYRVEPLGRRAARLTLLAGDRMRHGLPGLEPGSRGLGRISLDAEGRTA